MMRLKDFLGRFLSKIILTIMLGIMGGVMLAAASLLLALGVTIVREASTFADIPFVLGNLGQNANLSLDLLQELLQDMPFGVQMGYLFDALMQKQLLDPFTRLGSKELFVQALIVAACTNLFSLVLAPQRAISSAQNPNCFGYIASIMQLVCNALAIVLVTLIQRIFSTSLWIGFAIMIVAFGLEIWILNLRIRILALRRIAMHVIRHDIVGFLLKQLILGLFMCAFIHIIQNVYPTTLWEYILCIILVIATVPFSELVEKIF